MNIKDLPKRKRGWTPLHLTILFHHLGQRQHYTPDTDTSREYLKDLIAAGLVEMDMSGPGHPMFNYNATEKGRAHIENLCKVPLPVKKWVLPGQDS